MGIQDDLKKMAFLQALAGATDGDDTGLGAMLQSESEVSSEGMYIASIREAEAMVDTNPTGKNLASVAAYVSNPDNKVYGKPAEFHNLLTSYLIVGDYYHALEIGKYGLTMYPYDIDILADSIQAAGGAAQYEAGYSLIETAAKINKQYWNWRLFLMIAEFYKIQLPRCNPDEYEAVYSKGFKVIEDYMRYLPCDERAYNEQAEYYIMKNNTMAARTVLEKAIYDEIEDVDGTKCHLVAPQCCLTLIDAILGHTTEYEHIVEVADKGVQFTAQEQPSARMGYFRYRSAMAKDAIICRDQYKNKQTIQEALREYQCAFDLNSDSQYGKTIQERYAALSQNSQNPVTDVPLIKRKLCVEEGRKDK